MKHAALCVALCVFAATAAAAGAEVVRLSIDSAEASFDDVQGQWVLYVRLTDESALDFGDFTDRHIREKVKIRLDDRILVEPLVIERIDGGTVFIPVPGGQSSALLLRDEISTGGNVIHVEGADK